MVAPGCPAVALAPQQHCPFDTALSPLMTSTFSPLLLGTPRLDGALVAISSNAIGPSWADLLQRHGAAAAATGITGDFALAMPCHDGSVFMAVDRFAIRSLCYRVDGPNIHVATRADELATHSNALDPQALFDYLYFHIIPSPRTVYAGVRRLPPGHYGHFKDGVLTVAPYWVARFDPARSASFGSLKDEFRQLLQASVLRQLDGTPAACFLSGGTDSSTVAGMLAKESDQAVTAYSIGFEAEGYDEMVYARLAAKHFGVQHREYYVTPDDLVRDIPAVAASYDQPFGNSSALPTYHCSLQAKADGVTRLLAGDGGDELFGGNSRYATQRLFGHYQRVPQALRSGLMEPFFGISAVARTPGFSKGASYIRQANTPLPDRGQEYNLLRRLGFTEVLTPAFHAQINANSVLDQQRQVWASASCSDDLNRFLAYDWRYTLAECDLPKVVGTTGLAGLSVGFPMLDDALLDFSLRLPVDYKLKGMKLRWFFKEALRGFLPDEILAKKKQGFGLPFGVWTMRHAGLKKLAQDALATLAERGLVNPAFIRSLLVDRMPEHPHYYGTMVWILIVLEHWLRRHAPTYRIAA